jgi:hypothetical protein
LVKSHLYFLELGQTPHREGQRRSYSVVTLKQVDVDYCQTDSKYSLLAGSNMLLSYHLEHEGVHLFSDVFVCKKGAILRRLKHQVKEGQSPFHTYKRTQHYQYYLHIKTLNLSTTLN